MKLILPFVLSLLIFSDVKNFPEKLSDAAISILDETIKYDGSYREIKYPGGDVPPGTGVCTDVVVRAYRKLGIDLQKEVHEDMIGNFQRYPQLWDLKKPNKSIDHRRVPNLQMFFTRKGKSLPVTKNPGDYKPGEIVTWNINGKMVHIGIVTALRTPDGKRPMIVHNAGWGQVLEDWLFAFELTGHYQYWPD